MIFTTTLEANTQGRGFTELTLDVDAFVRRSGIQSGICSIFLCHTSASLIICENADPQVLRDLECFIARSIPDGDQLFLHTEEGPDDMPAHIRSVLTGTDITIPVRSGKTMLGTWQGIYLWEHRRRAHRRTVEITLVGEP